LIACAVLAATPVLLLDEPMIGLDPRGQRELNEILREVRDQGGAVIVSSHLLHYIETMCDRLVILKSGRAVAEGGIEELRRSSGNRSLEDVFLELTG
jgi:ABC-2 type transport system ATP-binding protein